MELAGMGFAVLCSLFMRSLYTLCDGSLLGILFGAVNGSIWEAAKTLLLPSLVWGMIEVMCLRLPLHRFTVAKTAALVLLGACYPALRLAGCSHGCTAALAAAAAVAAALLLFGSPFAIEWLFAPAVAVLFLIVSLYFSLTPFPPNMKIFRDPSTGLYGIIPKHYDYGASALDALF